jgi:hypothetical protein
MANSSELTPREKKTFNSSSPDRSTKLLPRKFPLVKEPLNFIQTISTQSLGCGCTPLPDGFPQTLIVLRE